VGKINEFSKNTPDIFLHSQSLGGYAAHVFGSPECPSWPSVCVRSTLPLHSDQTMFTVLTLPRPIEHLVVLPSPR
jgi:hypothetical protein